MGSLHLYLKDVSPAKRFLKEGFQSTAPLMPPMPVGDPWRSIDVLLEAESVIRKRGRFDEAKLDRIEGYWADLVRLLQVFAAKNKKDISAISAIRGKMSSVVYHPFVDRVIGKLSVAMPLDSAS